MGIGLLGISYAVCALIPGVFISEKMFDPKAIEDAHAADASEAAAGDAPAFAMHRSGTMR